MLIPFLFFWSVIKKDSCFSLPLSYIGLTLVSGAFISEYLGHFNANYWKGLLLWLFFAVVFFIPKTKLVNIILGSKKLWILMLITSICYFLLSLNFRHKELNSTNIKVLMEGYSYSDIFSSYLEHEYHQYVNFFIELKQANKDVTVIEEYSSLASIILDKPPSVTFDSLIHVLGDNYRDSYIDTLIENKPNFITTTNPNFSPWQAWSLNQNWWFYSYLLENYSIEKIFKNQYVWKINEKQINSSEKYNIKCNVINQDIEIISDVFTNTKLVSVTMDYTLDANKKIIILMENNISSKHSYTSINMIKKVNNVSFPIFMSKNKVTVRGKVLPIEKSDLFDIQGCHASIIDSPSAQTYIDFFTKNEQTTYVKGKK